MASRFRHTGKLFLVMAVAVTMTSVAGASSLFPPPGPPQPTMKRLDQVSTARCISSLPHVISEPGRYEVCGNLDLSEAGHGITVSASNVTIDLGGFTLHGGEGSLDGIHITSGSDNVTVRNGNLVGWGGDGINARSSDGELYCWGIRASSCQGHGISLVSGEIHNSVCLDNMGDGIHAVSTADDHSVWCWGSNASRNGGNGITISNGGIENTVCRDNMGHGVHVNGPAEGFLDESISLRNVTCVSNGSSGITIVNTPPAAIDSCVVSGNTGHGLHLTLASGRTGRNPQTGKEIKIAAKNNTGDGVLIDVAEALESSLHFRDSSFSENEGRGFSISCPDGSRVSVSLERCESSSNSQQGIHVENASLDLDHCRSSSNGSHGFHVVFNDASKAKTYNSTRSNRTGGIMNGGSGFQVDVAEGIDASCFFEGSSFSGNTGTGVSTLCPEDSSVEVTLRRCETSHNGAEGIRIVNSVLEIDGGVCANNVSHGIWLTGEVSSGAKAGYNNTRSNKASSLAISGNGGDGVHLEQVRMDEGTPSETLSLNFTKVEMSSNGGNGIHAVGNCHVSLDSTRIHDNEDAGLRLTTSSSSSGLSKADAKKALDGFVNNAGGGIVCMNANGTVAISLSEVGISRCGTHGIHLTAGENAESLTLNLDRCEVAENAGDGIHFDATIDGDNVCPSSYHLRDSVVRDNGDRVALTGNGSFSVCQRVSVSGSSISGNGGSGLLCGNTGHLSVGDTDSSGNGLDGLDISAEVARLSNVSCVGNGHNGALVVASSFQVSSCLFSGNGGHGLHCPSGSGSVRTCVVSSNTGNGIRIEGSGVDVCENIVTGHTTGDTDGAGISIHGTGNRVRGNMTSGNDNGVALFANGNPIYAGSSSGGENPVFEDDGAGVSGNAADFREISTSSNPFGNIVH